MLNVNDGEAKVFCGWIILKPNYATLPYANARLFQSWIMLRPNHAKAQSCQHGIVLMLNYAEVELC